MKSKDERKQTAFEKEYNQIMNNNQKQNAPFFQNPQWVHSGDFIIKFSLFQEMPNSITSTDTTVNL
jgi:hypothetical protein